MTTEQFQRWLRTIASMEAREVVCRVGAAIACAEKAGVPEREATIMLLAHLTCCASSTLKLDLRDLLSEVCEAAAMLEAAAMRSCSGQAGKILC